MWLTADQMDELFQRNKSTISRHIRNVFESGELKADSVVAFFATTAADGKNYNVAYYNLDVIISVGYRVNSHRGVQFRIRATQVLCEYLVKGFAMNDDLQNKMHFSAHGHTAAEIIYSRADADKDFTGLTSWTGALPKRTDAGIAKNYLSPDELDTLNRIVSLYLDFAELQAKSHKPMYMKDWIRKLDEFLSLSGKDLLTHAGTVSAEIAKQKADTEYDKYQKRIRPSSQVRLYNFLHPLIARQIGNEVPVDGAVLKGGEAGSGRLARRALLADNWLYLFSSK